jgi:RNA polymerase sigma-70 factor (ECF subfamily)
VGAIVVEQLERAIAGDARAFGELVTIHTPSVYRLARAVLGDDQAARDVVQETFLRAWQDLPRLRNPGSFTAWLHRIAANRAKSAWRVRERRAEVTWIDPVHSEGEIASDDFASVDVRLAFERAFSRLTNDQPTLIGLHYASGLSIVEVADVLGVPTGTAKSRLNAALVVLRKAMLESR